MSYENDGGPAFPTECANLNDHYEGMRLRDYFAAKVISGTVSNLGTFMSDKDAKRYAEEAYMIADAMLKAREVKQP